MIILRLFILIALLVFSGGLKAQVVVEQGVSKLFHLGASGKLVYVADAKGGRLPDFSHVGYHSGEAAIPHVPVKISLKPGTGDDTQRIQAALDQLGTLPLGKTGHRGALLLKRGVYRVAGELVLSSSGTVLRGEGNGPNGTVIIATGYQRSQHRRTLIAVIPPSGNLEAQILHGDQEHQVTLAKDSMQSIVDAHVPVGSHSFDVKSASGYKSGDRIVVYRPSTQKWIHAIGCDQLQSKSVLIQNQRWVKDGKSPGFYFQRSGSYSNYFVLKDRKESWDEFVNRVPISEDGKTIDGTRQWAAGDYDFYFERRITQIKGNRITIDAPIVQSMEEQYGGGAIYHYQTSARVTEVGIENLRLVSEFAAPIPGHPYGDPQELTRAENHAWHGIQIDRETENTWVRDVTGNHFGWSLVSASGQRATIQDCVNLGHASKITGGRRYPFMINGQLNLVQRCLTYAGRHEFVTQKKTAGPNVFVDCLGLDSKSKAGPHHRYSVGTLFDNVKSEMAMESRFRGSSGTGHGWAGSQTCFYNCVAPGFDVQAPPGGISWVIGSGNRARQNVRVAPASLYYQQVQDRLGRGALERLATQSQRNNLGKYLWVKERLKIEK